MSTWRRSVINGPRGLPRLTRVESLFAALSARGRNARPPVRLRTAEWPPGASPTLAALPCRAMPPPER
jgi:hypothetical protein